MFESIMRMIRWVYHLFRVDKVRGVLSDWQTSLCISRVSANYEKTRGRIASKVRNGQKVRVLFLVSDSSKWKMQSVYERLTRRSDQFELQVAVSIFGWPDSRSAAEAHLVETKSFFAQRGMSPQDAYSLQRHAAIPLSAFAPDIVFYDQPWDVLPEHMPEVVSRFALTCYVSYAVTTVDMMPCDCCMPFHRTLYRYFMQSEAWAEYAQELRKGRSLAGKVVSTGHPMLDIFRQSREIRATESRRLVVFAPHWTFPHPHNPNNMNLSTFLWTGEAMLDYARKHKENYWVFKPHPQLKHCLVKAGVMSVDEVAAYYKAWQELGECCESGDYPELFMRSSALITDSGSFLTEYACTGSPIIRLISPEAILHPCRISEKMLSTYYQVRTLAELESVLESVVVRGEDPNRESRLAAAKELNLLGTDAAGNIVRHLEELLCGAEG